MLRRSSTADESNDQEQSLAAELLNQLLVVSFVFTLVVVLIALLVYPWHVLPLLAAVGIVCYGIYLTW